MGGFMLKILNSIEYLCSLSKFLQAKHYSFVKLNILIFCLKQMC